MIFSKWFISFDNAEVFRCTVGECIEKMRFLCYNKLNDKLEFEEIVLLFELVTMLNIATAAEIHAISWRESHKSFCSKEFVDAHTTERQMKYIENEIKNGKLVQNEI